MQVVKLVSHVSFLLLMLMFQPATAQAPAGLGQNLIVKTIVEILAFHTRSGAERIATWRNLLTLNAMKLPILLELFYVASKWSW
jgi:hypothetical protein